jgi:hypothetical protein
MRLALTLLMLLASQTHAQPAVGINIHLWDCDATTNNQKYDISGPGQLLNHMIVHGTENSNPPLVWDISGPSNDSGTGEGRLLGV